MHVKMRAFTQVTHTQHRYWQSYIKSAYSFSESCIHKSNKTEKIAHCQKAVKKSSLRLIVLFETHLNVPSTQHNWVHLLQGQLSCFRNLILHKGKALRQSYQCVQGLHASYETSAFKTRVNLTKVRFNIDNNMAPNQHIRTIIKDHDMTLGTEISAADAALHSQD